jgi:hypothetical protein
MKLEFDTSKFQLTFYARRIKKDGALATVKRLESPYFALETRILDSSVAISAADDAGSAPAFLFSFLVYVTSKVLGAPDVLLLQYYTHCVCVLRSVDREP